MDGPIAAGRKFDPHSLIPTASSLAAYRRPRCTDHRHAQEERRKREEKREIEEREKRERREEQRREREKGD